MSGPHIFRRAVRFEEVDAAGFVYFPRVIALAHEALERILADAIPDGYARWVRQDVGLPCVHLSADFSNPLFFGDDVVVETRITKFGETSVTFDIAVRRGDGARCAQIDYVVACASLRQPAKRPLPDDLRAALERHHVGA